MSESEASDSTIGFSCSKALVGRGKRFRNPKQIGSDVEAELLGLRATLSQLRSNVLVQKFGFMCVSVCV